MWIQLAILVVSLILSYALRPKTPTPPPAALSDFKFPQIDEGTAQYVVFGDVWLEDWIVLGYGNFDTSPIQKKGGK